MKTYPITHSALLLLIISFAPFPAIAEHRTINLAEDTATTSEPIEITPGKLVVEITNMQVPKHYVITVNKSVRAMPSLKPPATFFKTTAKTSAEQRAIKEWELILADSPELLEGVNEDAAEDEMTTQERREKLRERAWSDLSTVIKTEVVEHIEAEIIEDCSGVWSEYERLLDTVDEKQVPSIVGRIEGGLQYTRCQTFSIINEIERGKDNTFSIEEVNVSDAERVTVTITRAKSKGDEPDKVWEQVYETPVKEWKMTYGFTFLPSNDDEFFTEALDDGSGMFEIVEKENRNDFDFVPALFYTWNTGDIFGRDAPGEWGFSAGLGFDLENPLVFAGPSVTIAENVSINFGGVVHKQSRLLGRYDLDDPIVGSDIDDDALTEDTYDVSWFFGLSFNFGSAPSTHKPASTGNGGSWGDDSGVNGE